MWYFNPVLKDNVWLHLSQLTTSGEILLCCLFSCLNKFTLWCASKLHLSHLNCLLSWWILSCNFTSSVRLNDFSHFPHLYGLSSVYITLCKHNKPLCVKVFEQNVHMCGFSPVCACKCNLKLPGCEKDLPHSVQS